MPVRPRLIGASEPIQTADGRIILLAPSGAHEHVELEGAPDGTAVVLGLLDGCRSLDEVVDTAAAGGVDGAVAREVVATLAEARLVDDAADDRRWLGPDEIVRYDRQLRYFAACADRPRAAVQAALADARVAVLGLGGLGGMAALTLAACGVGSMIGVDGDAVETSNLARQVLFRASDVGGRKAVIAARELRALNPGLEFTAIDRRLDSADAIAEVIACSDAVVAAIDSPAHVVGEWVDAACFRLGVPYIAMSQHPPLIRVGPLYLPGRTACFRCVREALVEHHPLLEDVAAGARDESPAATYAPACGVIGSLLAHELLALLGQFQPPSTIGRAWEFDLASLETRWDTCGFDRRCSRCA